MFLNKIRNTFCVSIKFVSATDVARAGIRGNICVSNGVRNNVSSFARALTLDGLFETQRTATNAFGAQTVQQFFSEVKFNSPF